MTVATVGKSYVSLTINGIVQMFSDPFSAPSVGLEYTHELCLAPLVWFPFEALALCRWAQMACLGVRLLEKVLGSWPRWCCQTEL